MSIIELIHKHPVMTVFIVWSVAKLIFRIYNRTIRAINIYKNGYPPMHCDADGDLKEENNDNDS